jgi:hypothetical protein
MRAWTLAVLVAIGLTGTARTTMAEPDDLTILVRVMNHTEIPQAVLALALAEATRIYNDIGGRLVWTESSTAEYRFTVRIISKPLSGDRVSDLHALGAAPGTKETRGRLAYAYFGPIERLARGAGTDVAIILGHVIAHELGHLLLPSDSHSMVGVMATGWDRGSGGRRQEGRAHVHKRSENGDP